MYFEGKSKEDPKYMVQNNKTGTVVARSAEALEEIEGKRDED